MTELDPYKVGEIAGPAAFSAGDLIVIRSESNTPARVRYRNSDVHKAFA